MKTRLALALSFLLAGTAAAQSTAPTGLTLWGGLGTEVFVIPGATLGLSATVAQLPRMNVDLRGSASAYLLPVPDVNGPFTAFNAELLFSGRNSNFNLYGGPSVGTVLGGLWTVGATGGLRGQFDGGNLGWFSEAHLRAAFDSAGLFPFPLVGGTFGVTYRF
ncbi:hypothetical protein [Deinococcus arcticus]|uniref:Outer membrane protein beta-barrel domain-containing protein n=1 Tax=Deinococcus arcticus TaxID=2136176 RepID=A0A2T3WAI5_9DEIO|nr:hypothetical protein [Deinococcus arcticus]PTA68915.1 hypothetical protein C8263_03670 [Deinococcus arcticus]